MALNRARITKLISLVILALWPCHVGLLGSSLFTEFYRIECATSGTLFWVLALLAGCVSFVAFSLFRAFAGLCDCSERYALVTLNAQLSFVAHTMVAFFALLFTAFGFSRLLSLQSCSDVEPPLSPLVIVCIINCLNGFMAIEQFGRTGFTVIEDGTPAAAEALATRNGRRGIFASDAVLNMSGIRIVYADTDDDDRRLSGARAERPVYVSDEHRPQPQSQQQSSSSSSSVRGSIPHAD